MVVDDMAGKYVVGTGMNGNDMVGKDIYMAQCTDRRVCCAHQMVRGGWFTKYRESCLGRSQHLRVRDDNVRKFFWGTEQSVWCVQHPPGV